MRFQAVPAAICAAAALSSGVLAQDAAAAAAAAVEIERPPSKIKGPFVEQFTDDWEKRWTPSHAKKEDSKSEEDWAYIGEWAVEEPSVFPGIKGDKGLVVKNPAAHHAISAKFDKPVNNKGKTLVVQYEVKLQNGLECGGAYMKLLQDNKKLKTDEFSNASPYVIMFGPDRCGATNKVHFIFKHKNPKTGEYEEKHLKSPPSARTNKLTTLYTLIVNPDNTFDLLIDGESEKKGSLLEDFTPPVNPDKEIDDSADTKPEDWEDAPKIPDPEATKPEEWDEDAPYEIVDTEAEKPADWFDDEPLTIPDPEAEKPEDWDDEEDGDWIPPQVPNPKCEEGAGCGEWKAPMKANPAFKGQWSAPFIDNPAYKGVWAPRKIANPDYFEDKTPANFEPIGAIGFEIWTMQSEITFDNIYVGHSIEDAEKFRAETFDIKQPIEKAQEEKDKPPTPETPKSLSDLKFLDDPVTFVRQKVDAFIALAQQDPVGAIQTMPEVAGSIGAGVVAVIALLATLVGGGAKVAPSKEEIKKAASKAKETATEAKDKAVDAAASGVETVKTEVNKRTTRSSEK